MIKLNKIFSNKYTQFIFLLYFVGIFLLSRTFIGFYVFGFRIGEFSMLLSLIIFIFSIFQFKSEIFRKNLDLNFFIACFFLLLTFVIFVTFNGSFSNLYSYKSSTYIWSIGYLFLGMIFAEFTNFKFRTIYIFLFINLFIYFYSIFGITDDLQNILLQYTDKFEYHKGSDLVIMFTSVIYLMNRLLTNKNKSFEVFLVFSSLYLPLMLFKSRSGFAAFVVFLIIEFLYLKKDTKLDAKRLIPLLIICFFILLQSLFIVNKTGVVEVEQITNNVESLVEKRKVPLNIKGVEVEKAFLFIENNRIFSGDGNLNWRLQIWQDVFFDLIEEGKLLTGFNFNNKFDAMDDPYRSGNDGTNENVHNFLVNVLGRGGLIHLFLYIYIFSLLFKSLISKHNFYFLSFPIAVVITSLFDASMENAHFPLIFYFVTGIVINLKKL